MVEVCNLRGNSTRDIMQNSVEAPIPA